MSETSDIQWCDATWNPVLGCSKVSEGCRGCYAIPQAWMKQSNRHEKIREAYAGLVEKRADGSLNWTGKVNVLPERLTLPLGWKQPKRIFVNSLSDLFHEEVPDEFIERVFGIMALAQRHTFQVLTKRPERMAAWFGPTGELEDRASLVSRAAAHDGSIVWDARGSDEWNYSTVAGMPGKPGSPERRAHLENRRAWPGWPLPNVWLGTSVEDDRVRHRVGVLRDVPAAIRFLSVEPTLGPLPNLDLAGIHWVITGGESGPRARPMHPDWARDLRDQCRAAGVAYFHKQNGEWAPINPDPEAEYPEIRPYTWMQPDGTRSDARTAGATLLARIGNHKSGRLLDGRIWNEFPTAALSGAVG